MLANSQAAMQEIEVGANVRVGVPDLDRSRRDHANLIGVVMDVSDERIISHLLGITRLFYTVSRRIQAITIKRNRNCQ